MTKDDFAVCLREGMTDVRVSPQLRKRVLLAAQGKDEKPMKKKISLAAALVLTILMVFALAFAAAYRAGILDFAGRFPDSYVPQNAQDYIHSDVLTLQNDLISAQITELYYDGRISRITVNVAPKDTSTMLIGTDLNLDDSWQNMRRLNHQWDEGDQRTLLDLYREGGFESIYAVEPWLWQNDSDESLGGSADYHWEDDGTLTLYCQEEFATAKAARECRFRLYLTPYEMPVSPASTRLKEGQIILEAPLTLQEAAQAETYISTAPAVFAQSGVQIEEVRIEVKPQEIHAFVEFTIIDREAYAQMEDGLWFEFISPESNAAEPYAQRLMSGMSGSGLIVPLDGDGNPETATRFRQSETLGRNELHPTYTLRAFNCWDKTRYETHTFEMKRLEE